MQNQIKLSLLDSKLVHRSSMKKILFLFIIIFNYQISYAENKIAYIDIDFILNNSIVGQSISDHIKKIKEKKNSEFKTIEKQLSDKENDIVKQKNIIEKNEFEKKIKNLKNEIKDYRKKKLLANEEINKKKIDYTKQVLKVLDPIISKYVEDNSINVVFPKKNIIIAKKNLDITDSVMNLLNSQIINVEF